MPEDIKDIKSPIDLPHIWTWVWVMLAVIVIVALVAWLVFSFFKKPRPEEKIERVPLSAWEKAYSRLENLKLKNLMDRLHLKPFYIELSDITRRYLEERFSIKAPEMTTEEFLDSLRNSPVLNDSQQQILKEFLYTCDMVKFAKFQPNAAEAQKSFDLVKLLIDQTHGN